MKAWEVIAWLFFACLGYLLARQGSKDARKKLERVDTSLMPVGIGADTATIQASENLAAGDFVNVHNSGGARIRKADASNGREAHGFVLSPVTTKERDEYMSRALQEAQALREAKERLRGDK